MMNGVTNYGMSMNSQVNFQGKNRAPKKQIKRLLNDIEKNITEQQRASQKRQNNLEVLINKLQKGELSSEEVLKEVARLLDEVQGKLKPPAYNTEIGQRFKDVFI